VPRVRLSLSSRAAFTAASCSADIQYGGLLDLAPELLELLELIGVVGPVELVGLVGLVGLVELLGLVELNVNPLKGLSSGGSTISGLGGYLPPVSLEDAPESEPKSKSALAFVSLESGSSSTIIHAKSSIFALSLYPILRFALRDSSRRSVTTSSHRSKSRPLALFFSSGRESMPFRSLARIVVATSGGVSLVTQIFSREVLLVVGGGEERWRWVRSVRSLCEGRWRELMRWTRTESEVGWLVAALIGWRTRI
jgi:hypothetical protein